jgi:O-antigen/teichoic acid export membrane protein
MSVMGLLTLFSLPGMNVAVTLAVAQGNERTLWPAARARLRFSVVGVVALLGFAGVFAARGQAGMARLLLIAAPLFPAVAAADTYLAFLTGKRDFRLYGLLQAAEAALPVPLIFAALRFDGRVQVAALASLAAVALFHLLLLGMTARRVKRGSSIDADALRYGRRVSGVHLVSIVHYHLTRLGVGTLLGPADLAVFAIAAAWAEAFRQASHIFNMQWLPRLAAADEADARTTLRRTLIVGVPVMLLAGTAAVAVLPLVIPWLFTPQYHASIPYGQILVAGAAAAFAGSQFKTFLAARAATGAQYWLAVSALLVEILGLGLFIPRFGLAGAVVVRSAAQIWPSAFGWWLVRRGPRAA